MAPIVQTGMLSQKDLAERFEAGETYGRASNVSIHQATGGRTLLVGYGWAVYAVRYASGKIVAYRGWHGYSPSTSSQLTVMGISHPADTSVPEDSYRDRVRVDDWVMDCARLADFDLSAMDG